MSFRQILRILGVLMLIYSVTLLPPFALSLYLEDGNATAFSVAFVDISVLGMLIWFPNRRCKQDLTPRDGFIVVLMFVSLVNIGWAFWIGEQLGNTAYGFFAVAGFWFVVALLLLVFKNKWLKTPVSNILITEILKEKVR